MAGERGHAPFGQEGRTLSADHLPKCPSEHLLLPGPSADPLNVPVDVF